MYVQPVLSTYTIPALSCPVMLCLLCLPADLQQYFPTASAPAIDLLDKLLTFDPGG
jgi:hypothetical protein